MTTTTEYREAINEQTAQFIRVACVQNPSLESSAAELYDAYVAFAERHLWPPVTPHMFGRRLREMNIWRKRGKTRVFYVGIAAHDHLMNARELAAYRAETARMRSALSDLRGDDLTA